MPKAGSQPYLVILAELLYVLRLARDKGLLLSLLLYVFYNANLVEKKIDRRGGAIGFVDDFNA